MTQSYSYTDFSEYDTSQGGPTPLYDFQVNNGVFRFAAEPADGDDLYNDEANWHGPEALDKLRSRVQDLEKQLANAKATLEAAREATSFHNATGTNGEDEEE